MAWRGPCVPSPPAKGSTLQVTLPLFRQHNAPIAARSNRWRRQAAPLSRAHRPSRSSTSFLRGRLSQSSIYIGAGRPRETGKTILGGNAVSAPLMGGPSAVPACDLTVYPSWRKRTNRMMQHMRTNVRSLSQGAYFPKRSSITGTASRRSFEGRRHPRGFFIDLYCGASFRNA